MKTHWLYWMNMDRPKNNLIKQLADRGVKRIRLPIGDWTMKQYGPYVDCMEGVLDRVKWLMDLCFQYGIGVLVDVHAAKGS